VRDKVTAMRAGPDRIKETAAYLDVSGVLPGKSGLIPLMTGTSNNMQ